MDDVCHPKLLLLLSVLAGEAIGCLLKKRNDSSLRQTIVGIGSLHTTVFMFSPVHMVPSKTTIGN